MTRDKTYDVLVMGEVLVELSTTEPLQDGAPLRLGFSGDALNAAAAAAAAGARTALLARIAADELGESLVERVCELGIDTSLLMRVPGQHGLYMVHSDPAGGREFIYARRGSAGSTLEPADVTAVADTAEVVLCSGITCAISASAEAAVDAAARQARRFIYDPNYRPRLTTSQAAAAALARLAPYAELITPAWPGETTALLGLPRENSAAENSAAEKGPAGEHDAAPAARRCRELGARAAAVTCGARGVFLDDGVSAQLVPAVPPPALVDQTGAGDSLVGTVAARLALGDTLVEAVRLGAAAASLCLQGQGGTGHVASLSQVRAHLERWGVPVTGGIS